MKRLIVCCDGTWNDPQQEENGQPAPTNVFKLYNAVAELGAAGEQQIRYYHPGVGAGGGIIDPVLGGALGVGITRQICSAYQWLASHYAPGDEIYLFGFSRGAFTARCVAGFLGYGLIDPLGLAPAEVWDRVHKAYDEGYRKRKRLSAVNAGWDLFNGGAATPVRFVGVWDTVGALGIPDDLALLNLFDDPAEWRFHDSALGDHVLTGRHAMAIDEMRSSFCVTRWSNIGAHADALELWFPGVHSDVGGGYANTDLSAGALDWMIGEAKKVGLGFHAYAAGFIQPDPLGQMHDSYKGVFAHMRSRPRNIPAMQATSTAFHPSALARQASSPLSYVAYHPTRLLAQAGDSFSFSVFANQHWNASGLYLEPGVDYCFDASGEWLDAKDACNWKGTQDHQLTVGDIARAAGSALGKAENLYKRATANQDSDFVYTKRVEKYGWFTLVGAIANDDGSKTVVGNDGSPTPHQYAELYRHQKQSLKLRNGGYLYCFANDVWSLYGNNAGSLWVTVTRL